MLIASSTTKVKLILDLPGIFTLTIYQGALWYSRDD